MHGNTRSLLALSLLSIGVILAAAQIESTLDTTLGVGILPEKDHAEIGVYYDPSEISFYEGDDERFVDVNMIVYNLRRDDSNYKTYHEKAGDQVIANNDSQNFKIGSVNISNRDEVPFLAIDPISFSTVHVGENKSYKIRIIKCNTNCDARHYDMILQLHYSLADNV